MSTPTFPLHSPPSCTWRKLERTEGIVSLVEIHKTKPVRKSSVLEIWTVIKTVLFFGVMTLWTKNHLWHIDVKLHLVLTETILFLVFFFLFYWNQLLRVSLLGGLWIVIEAWGYWWKTHLSFFWFLFVHRPVVFCGWIAYIMVLIRGFFSTCVLCVSPAFFFTPFCRWMEINSFHHSPTHSKSSHSCRGEALRLWF